MRILNRDETRAGAGEPRTPAVLCYGHDEVLLRTRQRILETIGIPAAVAFTGSEFCETLLRSEVALILLCQSLSCEECTAATAFAKEHSASSKLLLMYNRPGKCTLSHVDAELYCGDGPAALVRTVKELVYADAESRDRSAGSTQA